MEGVMAREGQESSIRFDFFELDAAGCQLRRRGLPVDLPPQALRILLLLAARPNELVTRKEVKEMLWPDEFHGDFDSRLNFAVKRLREALGDSAELPRYILTERKAGYRFIAPVRNVESDSPGEANDLQVHAHAPSALNESGSAGFQPGRNSLAGWLVAVAVSVVVVLALVFWHRAANMSISGAGAPAGSYHDTEGLPEISAVSQILPQARQRIEIRGRGFGMHVPYAHTDSPYLAIRDITGHWAAGRLVPHNWDEVMLDVESWADPEIVISGFSGDYGVNGWKLTEGDELEIAVWNPQSGVGPARYRVSVGSTNATR
jgi:DNA-binding winged helix-turn-helix (wHTH) protein